jgi:prepilin-type N-terminal cleavage/methylation domain-containing protein/prepilin-type processing-associated H-X9-DG protein
MPRNNSGFTLIELLVVIAIIAILAAILFPVFAQAKMAAKKSVSLSNTKQLALSFYMYTNDFDDTLPYEQANPYGIGETAYAGPYTNGALDPTAETNWSRGVFPYVKSYGVFQDNVLLKESNDGWGCYESNGKASEFCSSYAYNGIASGKSSTAIPGPATTIVISEYDNSGKTALTQPTLAYYTGAPGGNGATVNHAWDGIDGIFQAEGYPGGPANTEANGGANFGFSDGHAKYMAKSTVSYDMFTGPGSICVNVEGGPFGKSPNAANVGSTLATGVDCSKIHMIDPAANPPTKGGPAGGQVKYDVWNIVPFTTGF